LDKMNESDQVTVGGISVLFLALLPIGGQIMALSFLSAICISPDINYMI